jgi:hypothetical protein
MHNLLQSELQENVAAHITACRLRIPRFVADNYAWPGAWRLNRQAWGWDIAIAPFNFILGFPNFLLRILAMLLELLKLRRTARWLGHLHLGLPTRVQRSLTARVKCDLLGLPERDNQANNPVLHLIESVAVKPAQIYVQTRNVAADITAGTLAAIIGVIFFKQFTPGSFSAGSVIAQQIAREQAIGDFPFGETLGGVYYGLFPVNPSLTVIVITLLGVIATIAVVAAFSGIVHDPLQSATGIHQRRLNQLLDAIEASANQTPGKEYRPKDTIFGRIYDLVDWIKGLLSF